MADTAAVYIGKLVLEDFKAFKGHTEIELIDGNGHMFQWTVFLGNNNTGKTNLLKAIADLEPVIQDFSYDKTGKSDYYAPLYSQRFVLKNNMQFFKDNGSMPQSFGAYLYIMLKNKINDAKVTDNKVSEIKLATVDIIKYNNLGFWHYGLGSWRMVPSPNYNFGNLKIYGYGVTRKIGNNGISEKNEELNAASLFDPEHRLTNIEEWLFQLDYASKNGQSAAGERLGLLKEIIISEILPEISDFRFTTTYDFKNYIEYKTQEGWFTFDQLGYGYQTTISWIIDLCKKMFERYPKSQNPLKEPAVVLVDELDLHLHPKWQRTIIGYLSKTFPLTQFIVTTHSPLILQTLEKVNIYVLQKKEDHVKIQRVPFQTLQGWSVEEILSEIMEMDEDVFSDRHNQLFKEFDAALDIEDHAAAKMAYDDLMKILHPNSAERKILKLQLSQIAPDDKA